MGGDGVMKVGGTALRLGRRGAKIVIPRLQWPRGSYGRNEGVALVARRNHAPEVVVKWDG